MGKSYKRIGVIGGNGFKQNPAISQYLFAQKQYLFSLVNQSINF